MSYKLMIKTHNVTELKYLCITSRANWKEYSGSGRKWLNHLKKHGFDFSTELLFESDDYDEFLTQCVLYSSIYDVSLNEEFANVVPEWGYNNGYNKSNLELWWIYATEEMKKEVIRKRSESIKENHWSKFDDKIEISKKISLKIIEHWNTCTIDERRQLTEYMRIKSKEFFKDKNTPEYEEYILKQSLAMKKVYSDIPFDIISNRNRKQRLRMSPEKAEIRANKIREIYASGKHNKMFEEMSEKRKGTNNPYAKIIVWMGERFTKSDFNSFLKEHNIKVKDAYSILNSNEYPNCYKDYIDEIKVYEKIVCPYCNKESVNKPSSFKRWHFDNCKEKK